MAECGQLSNNLYLSNTNFWSVPEPGWAVDGDQLESLYQCPGTDVTFSESSPSPLPLPKPSPTPPPSPLPAPLPFPSPLPLPSPLAPSPLPAPSPAPTLQCICALFYSGPTCDVLEFSSTLCCGECVKFGSLAISSLCPGFYRTASNCPAGGPANLVGPSCNPSTSTTSFVVSAGNCSIFPPKPSPAPAL